MTDEIELFETLGGEREREGGNAKLAATWGQNEGQNNHITRMVCNPNGFDSLGLWFEPN
jgi:hypothetical protein